MEEFVIVKDAKLIGEDREIILEKNDRIKVTSTELKEAKNQAFSDFDANFRSNFIGGGDLDSALDTVEASGISEGYGPDWLAEMYMAKVDDFGGVQNADKIDIVAMVYDIIYWEAQDEILNKTGLDINELDIEVAGNYLATSFDYRASSQTELEDTLVSKGFSRKDFSEPTQWFFEEMDLSREFK